jgi:hypothetical protein
MKVLFCWANGREEWREVNCPLPEHFAVQHLEASIPVSSYPPFPLRTGELAVKETVFTLEKWKLKNGDLEWRYVDSSKPGTTG